MDRGSAPCEDRSLRPTEQAEGDHVKRMWALAAIAALSLATGCSPSAPTGPAGSPSTSQDRKPYLIAMTATLTSSYRNEQAQGEMAQAAAKAAIGDVNRQGGIAGRTAELVVLHNHGVASESEKPLQELIDKGGVDAHLTVGDVVPAITLPVARDAKILSFNGQTAGDTADPAKYPLNFDMLPERTRIGDGLEEDLKLRGAKRIGLLTESLSGATSVQDDIAAALKGSPFTLVGTEQFDGPTGPRGALRSLKAKKVDTVLYWDEGHRLDAVLEAKEDLGWAGPVDVLNDDVMRVRRVDQRNSGVSVLVYRSARNYDNPPEVKRAVTLMKGAGGLPADASLMEAYPWDAIHLIKAAADEVGSADDAQALARALEDPQVQSRASTIVLPTYAFTADLHRPTVTGEDFVLVPPNTLVNGQYQFDPHSYRDLVMPSRPPE